MLSIQRGILSAIVLGVLTSHARAREPTRVVSVTPREGLMAANALMQQAFQVVRIISPAIAGAMVNWVGARPAYYFDGASFIFSASMIAAIAIKRAAAAT